MIRYVRKDCSKQVRQFGGALAPILTYPKFLEWSKCWKKWQSSYPPWVKILFKVDNLCGSESWSTFRRWIWSNRTIEIANLGNIHFKPDSWIVMEFSWTNLENLQVFVGHTMSHLPNLCPRIFPRSSSSPTTATWLWLRGFWMESRWPVEEVLVG